ncbi:MAG: hypothetical protein Salg2KO_14380 [Salibacteraceae bacterium]
MKLLSTIVLVFLSTYTAVIGQTDSSTVSPPEDSVEVVITPKKGQDSTIVKVAGMKIIVLNDEKNEPKQIVVDTDVNGKDSIISKNCKDEDVSHWAGIRIGVNGYLLNDGLPIPATHDYLELDYSRSISVDVNLFEKDIRLYKQYVELVTGLGLHFSNYTFESKFATINNSDPLSATVDSTIVLDKNKLRATYITAPLMIGFSTNKDENKAYRFAVGGQVSWRIASRLKQEYSLAGQRFKPRIRSDYDLNPFLFHAIASVGYGPVNIYANYGLNTLFEESKTLPLTPFDMGVQIMF